MLIGVGGGLGAVTRYLLGSFIGKKGEFPLATLVINVIGSFLLGLLSGHMNDTLEYLLCIGFLGGFTTYSTFGYEAVNLILKKEYLLAALYVVSSILVSFIACYIGFQI